MTEHILFLTGKLAEKSLCRVLDGMQPTEFSYDVRRLGLNVAALMTTDMIRRRLGETDDADRILVPGYCRGDIDALSQHLGVPVARGPKDLKDLPRFFGRDERPPDLSLYDVQIFAEIVDAPNISVEAIMKRAAQYRDDGADIIDLGCLPETPFPHMAETIQALKGAGYKVSIDSVEADNLLEGGKAGADYLLSLKEDTLWVADHVASIPVLIPDTPADLDSLYRAMRAMDGKDRRYMVDPILEPIHFGFTDSILRYHSVRSQYPEAEIMMGIGNLTELTHADTAGINAVLMGIISELRITHVLTTEVSDHCRTVVREVDLARRILYLAREENSLPQHIDNGMMPLHELKPWPYGFDEIQETAAAIKDPNFRIQVSPEGVHIYNRDGLHTAQDPFELYPELSVEQDGAHAFYLGAELARAQIAWQLGKLYTQDEELRWGVAVEAEAEDLNTFKEVGPTLWRKSKNKKSESNRQSKTDDS